MKIARIALIFVCTAAPVLPAEERKVAPQELVQYVQDAVKLGLKDPQILHHASSAGWPADVVNHALLAVRKGSQETLAAQPPGNASSLSSSTKEPLPASAPSEGIQLSKPDDYRIGAGDLLQITVWKEPEASVPNTVVRPDGKIGLPLIKEVEVNGLTTSEAEQVITSRLSKLIPAADVAVVVTAINSKKVYIVGAVKKEGPLPYTYRMTVMQAISEAGGLSDYAKRKKIYILRTENGKDFRLPFDYDAVLRGERMELNVPLLSGDTLVVPH